MLLGKRTNILFLAYSTESNTVNTINFCGRWDRSGKGTGLNMFCRDQEITIKPLIAWWSIAGPLTEGRQWKRDTWSGWQNKIGKVKKLK